MADRPAVTPAYRVRVGDAAQVLTSLPPACFDAVLCDPPYGLRFMGKGWDAGVPGAALWRECLRLVRPGAPLLAAGGTRTYHRLACAIEDGGWAIRDCVGYAWVYATGFPKSVDLSKAIDAHLGATREVTAVSLRAHPQRALRVGAVRCLGCGLTRNGTSCTCPVDAGPATPEGAAWQGQGTALAPAWEPYVLAQLPPEGTYAANALAHGVAGLAVDASRIPVAPSRPGNTHDDGTPPADHNGLPRRTSRAVYAARLDAGAIVGRWPKNLILGPGAGPALDAQAGPRPTHGGRATVRRQPKTAGRLGAFQSSEAPPVAPEGGGPSRFFYAPKVSARERQAGLPPGLANDHPTLKPIDLCRYLARMLLPPWTGRPRRLLVPFAGAGSEMIGALLAGWDEVLGVELDPAYAQLARARLAHWVPDARDRGAPENNAPRAEAPRAPAAGKGH